MAHSVEKEAKAYAKINIHLEILNKRQDEYHNLQSIFVKTNLYDQLKITIIPQQTGYHLTTDSAELQALPQAKNLLYRAYKLYLSLCPEQFAVDIVLKKNIPSQAGLGGGSSDAATLLLQLQSYFNAVPLAILKEKATFLGADIPFFLSNQMAALVSGLGEQIEGLEAFPLYYIIVKPEQTVSTAWAFQQLARPTNYQALLPKAKLKALFTPQQVLAWPEFFFNSFEEVFNGEYAFINAYKQLFKEQQAFYAQLTGSGSAYVGFFLTAEAALKAYDCFKNSPSWCFCSVLQ